MTRQEIDLSHIFVVIPARYASTRLPAKPLRPLAGVAMIVRTARAALASGFPVIVAHDDARIAEAVVNEPVTAIATRESHQNGTERLCEVAEKMGWADDTIVVNVQGDEPLLPPKLIAEVAEALTQMPSAAVATLAAPLAENDDPHDPNIVKVVCDQDGKALYFSRAPIPFPRDKGENAAYLRHIGIYAYRVATLKKYRQLSINPLENLEKLEQLRFLENGLTVAVGITYAPPPAGVDCEEDVIRVEALLQQQHS